MAKTYNRHKKTAKTNVKSKRYNRHKKSPKINVKAKFKNAMFQLRRISKQKQRNSVATASNEFIKDLSKHLAKIRMQPHLVKNKKHRTQLKRNRGKLLNLINPQVSLGKKRGILLMKGGIIPLLIPIICASIGAAGTVGAAATSAAIMKS